MPRKSHTVEDISNGTIVVRRRHLTPVFVGSLTAAGLLVGRSLPDRRLLLPLRFPPGEKIVVEAIGKLPGYLYVVLCGFALGYGATRSAAWARWRILRALFSYQGWIYNQKSLRARLWGFLVKILSGALPQDTYSLQTLLPKLPVPPLDQTLDRYLHICKHIVTADEFELTEKAVDEFRTKEGPKLQAFLQKRFKETDNWLSDYWLSAAYLSSREPIAINSNYYVMTNVQPQSTTTDPLARAATIVRQMADYERLISSEQLPPSLLQETVPLCMAGYRYAFNTCRIPGEYTDEIKRTSGMKHIVIMRNSHFFQLDLYGSGGDKLLTTEEIKIQLEKICKIADDLSEEAHVAALTAQNRTVWAKHRKLLAEKNSNVLAAVESAMFMVTLDPFKPKDYHQHAKAILTGHGNDRWFDKCSTVVIFGNAYSGYNVEHSVVDATVIGLLAESALSEEKYENNDIIKNPLEPPRQLAEPRRLQWNLTDLEGEIEKATVDYRRMIDDLDLYVLNAEYGKGFPKKCRLSPDGFFQMALQLAYYRLHREIPKTYEPSTARMFLLGRTETVHPVSCNSVCWVKAMQDPNATKHTKIELLKRAIKHQTQFRLDATVGGGCDRHLLGLYCASREMGMDVPNIFRDKAWAMPFKLSSSQTPTRIAELSSNLDWEACGGGFGPGCQDGYGVSYIILGDDKVNFHITSWRNCVTTDSAKFGEMLKEVMTDLKKLLSN